MHFKRFRADSKSIRSVENYDLSKNKNQAFWQFWIVREHLNILGKFTQTSNMSSKYLEPKLFLFWKCKSLFSKMNFEIENKGKSFLSIK